MKNNRKNFIKAIMAGICIGLGGTCFLALDNKVIGAFMFSLGLLTICMNKFLLFTGKVCFARTKNDALNLILVWFGNLFGCSIVGLMIHYLKPQFVEKANGMCTLKLSEGINVILLGILCNILIYFAIKNFNGEGEKHIVADSRRVLALIVCVMAFILCGFEHCIANMYYFFVSDMVLKSFIYLTLNTIGNAIGGFAMGLICEKLYE